MAETQKYAVWKEPSIKGYALCKDRSSCCLGQGKKPGVNSKGAQGHFFGDRIVLYIDCDGGYAISYKCQNSSSGSLKISEPIG